MLTVVITRHGLTKRSTPEQHLGQTIDVGLSREGGVQARRLGRRLAAVAFERIISSPLRRARQTAEIVAAGPPGQQLPIEVDPRLAEMDYGRWEGLTYEQVDAQGIDVRRRWEADPASNACPAGESGNDVAERASAFLQDLISWREAMNGRGSDGERPVLVVGHSTLNRIVVCVATGIPVREYRRRLSQDPANVTVLRFEPAAGPTDARIVLLNDVAHLRKSGDLPWA